MYGSSSTIPDDAEFWMEGVREGKITLEWHYQKGDIDVKHEQTFLVSTHQSKEKWLEQLSYMIRLQTSDDHAIDKDVDVRITPHTSRGFANNISILSEYYDFYEQMWYQDPGQPKIYDWAGLARVVGAQVISGLSDSEYGRLGGAILTPGVFTAVDKLAMHPFQNALMGGGKDIFDDVGWQHMAHRYSGYYALDHVNTKSQGFDLTNELLEAWFSLTKADQNSDASLIPGASLKIAFYEQNTVIVPAYADIAVIGFGKLDLLMSLLAENPVEGGAKFTEVTGSPFNLLSNTAMRWEWVTAGLDGQTNQKIGVIKAWQNRSLFQQANEVSEHLDIAGRKFSQVWAFTTNSELWLLPPLEVQVRDRFDQPGNQ